MKNKKNKKNKKYWVVLKHNRLSADNEILDIVHTKQQAQNVIISDELEENDTSYMLTLNHCVVVVTTSHVYIAEKCSKKDLKNALYNTIREVYTES